MVQRLVAYRILRYAPRARHYTAHPLIRTHCLARLTEADRAQAQAMHELIKNYYLGLTVDLTYRPTLDDLLPAIEAVHHACRAGSCDEGYSIYQGLVNQGDYFVITGQLGAYETDLALMREFFPGGDTSQEPQVSDPRRKRLILNDVGFCLMNLGRLGLVQE